ncbi:MAG: hypothetical protein JRD04_12735 [Deltaproteobacteria bacterium]|nr:hypothetical protein [Deltaproteobacteria bacterium]
MDWTVLVKLAETFGIPVALLALFIYFDVKRRKRDDNERSELVGRMNGLEDYQRNKLEGLVVESTEAHREVSDVCKQIITTTEKVSQTQSNLTTVLQNRPCLRNTFGEGA